MYGIKNFTAIINPPQSAILAVGQDKNYQLSKMIKLSFVML